MRKYTPPPGPLPTQNRKRQQEFEPPLTSPSPKRGRDSEPQVYMEPLAPPPVSGAYLQSDRSPANNAKLEEANRARAWCAQNPLWQPRLLEDRHYRRVREGDNRLILPNDTSEFTCYNPNPGQTYIRTFKGTRDDILQSALPVYAALRDAPVVTGMPRTCYFEVHVKWIGDRYAESQPARPETDSGIAIGFVAPPYPERRLPGLHRGSLAVHGNDGRRYVNTTFGGRPFAPPFKRGDVVGIGMQFGMPYSYRGSPPRVPCEVFFTHNGERLLGWDLHEDRDARSLDGDITGLAGECDLLAAVGVFGSVEFDIHFKRENWLYQPPT